MCIFHNFLYIHSLLGLHKLMPSNGMGCSLHTLCRPSWRPRLHLPLKVSYFRWHCKWQRTRTGCRCEGLHVEHLCWGNRPNNSSVRCPSSTGPPRHQLLRDLLALPTVRTVVCILHADAHPVGELAARGMSQGGAKPAGCGVFAGCFYVFDF